MANTFYLHQKPPILHRHSLSSFNSVREIKKFKNYHGRSNVETSQRNRARNVKRDLDQKDGKRVKGKEQMESRG